MALVVGGYESTSGTSLTSVEGNTSICACTNYNYTVSTGSIVPGTVDIGNHVDDGGTVISLPFSYTLYDQSFTMATVGFGKRDNNSHRQRWLAAFDLRRSSGLFAVSRK